MAQEFLTELKPLPTIFVGASTTQHPYLAVTHSAFSTHAETDTQFMELKETKPLCSFGIFLWSWQIFVVVCSTLVEM